MKNLNLAVAICLTLIVAACSKKGKNELFCVNKAKVKVVTESGYVQNISTNEELFITNYAEFAAELKVGNECDIEFDFIAEKDGTCGNGIMEGGCVLTSKKIRVCKLKVYKKADINNNNCLGTTEKNTKEMSLIAFTAVKIQGDKLITHCGYSGCSEDDYKVLLLKCNTTYFLNNMAPTSVLPIEVTTNQGIICTAFFEKDVCFDLSTVKANLKAKLGANLPSTIQLQYTDGGVRKTIPWIL